MTGDCLLNQVTCRSLGDLLRNPPFCRPPYLLWHVACGMCRVPGACCLLPAACCLLCLLRGIPMLLILFGSPAAYFLIYRRVYLNTRLEKDRWRMWMAACWLEPAAAAWRMWKRRDWTLACKHVLPEIAGVSRLASGTKAYLVPGYSHYIFFVCCLPFLPGVSCLCRLICVRQRWPALFVHSVRSS